MRTARMITRIAPVITLLLLVPASPVSPAGRRVRDSGRPPAPRAPIERVTSELVLIETYVTGADGRPIPDLTSDDFVLLVDGRRSPIASIEYRETAVPSSPAQAPQSAVTSVSSARRFVLFFEDGISAPNGQPCPWLCESAAIPYRTGANAIVLHAAAAVDQANHKECSSPEWAA